MIYLVEGGEGKRSAEVGQALYMSASPQRYRGSDEENEEIATQKSIKAEKKVEPSAVRRPLRCLGEREKKEFEDDDYLAVASMGSRFHSLCIFSSAGLNLQQNVSPPADRPQAFFFRVFVENSSFVLSKMLPLLLFMWCE